MQEQSATLLETLSAIFQNSQELFIHYGLATVGAIVLFIVGSIIARTVANAARRGLTRVKKIDPVVASFFANFVRYGILSLVVVMVLGQFGVQTTSIVAALGAAGLAIGLALQGTLQHVAAGIMLLILRPFQIGDYIDTGAISGVVDETGLFTTELKTLDGLYRTVPNSQLWNVPITNFSKNATRRYDLSIGIDYEDDINQAEALLLALASEDDRILNIPAPTTFVAELGDSAVTVTLRYWTRSTDFWNTSRDMTKKAKLSFDENGISIPFPQVTYSRRGPEQADAA